MVYQIAEDQVLSAVVRQQVVDFAIVGVAGLLQAVKKTESIKTNNKIHFFIVVAVTLNNNKSS